MGPRLDRRDRANLSPAVTLTGGRSACPTRAVPFRAAM